MPNPEPSSYDPCPGRRDEDLLTPGEFANLMRVDPKTVGRWAKTGRIAAIRTIGGHRRFRVSDIRNMVREGREQA